MSTPCLWVLINTQQCYPVITGLSGLNMSIFIVSTLNKIDSKALQCFSKHSHCNIPNITCIKCHFLMWKPYNYFCRKKAKNRRYISEISVWFFSYIQPYKWKKYEINFWLLWESESYSFNFNVLNCTPNKTKHAFLCLVLKRWSTIRRVTCCLH